MTVIILDLDHGGVAQSNAEKVHGKQLTHAR